MNCKSINDLLSDKIVDMGIDETSEFNRIIFLEELEDIFDNNLMQYIKDNIKDILVSIQKNEKVAEVVFDDSNPGFDMVFYWSYCLDEKGKEILKRSEELTIELEYEDVVDLSSELWYYDNTDDKERRNHIDDLIKTKVKEDNYEL